MAVPADRDYRVAAPAGAPISWDRSRRRPYAQRDDAERLHRRSRCGSTSFEILNDGSLNVYDLYREIQAGTAPHQPPEPFAQSFNYYDGEPFVGLPFGQLGEFGALVRTESLVLTEEILRDAYLDPANPSAPRVPPYLKPQGVTSWPAEYPKEFQADTPPLAGYVFADGSDHRTCGYFAQASRVEFDFHRAGLAAPRTAGDDSRPTRQRYHDGL